MVAQASVLVHAPLDCVHQAVLDPSAYSDGATKVQDMVVESRAEGQLVARINGHLGPFHSSIRARYTLHHDRVDLEMLQGRLRDFRAVFLFEPQGDAIRLTHREQYDFGYPLISPLLDRVLHSWATKTVEAEVRALKVAAEARAQAA
ncbi:MAG: SRPBCC family protein [Candidatus Dormibacteria bacterium]